MGTGVTVHKAVCIYTCGADSSTLTNFVPGRCFIYVVAIFKKLSLTIGKITKESVYLYPPSEKK